MKHKCENTLKISLSASWQYSCQMYTYSGKPRHRWRPPQSILNLQQDRGQSLVYVSLWHYPFIKKQRHYLANIGPCNQGCVFSSSHVWMWQLDSEESWAPKNCCFRTVVLTKTPESPLDCKEIQPVHPKGNQSWIFIGRTDAEAETPILWPPRAKSWLSGKDPDAGRDWGQEEKGMTEDEMARWHHRLHGHEFEWTPGVGDGQGGLACCGSWGRKEPDTTEWLNWWHYP